MLRRLGAGLEAARTANALLQTLGNASELRNGGKVGWCVRETYAMPEKRRTVTKFN